MKNKEPPVLDNQSALMASQKLMTAKFKFTKQLMASSLSQARPQQTHVLNHDLCSVSYAHCEYLFEGKDANFNDS